MHECKVHIQGKKYRRRASLKARKKTRCVDYLSPPPPSPPPTHQGQARGFIRIQGGSSNHSKGEVQCIRAYECSVCSRAFTPVGLVTKFELFELLVHLCK
eukprot:1158340-Pelagomonas_calceolata.AAC.2